MKVTMHKSLVLVVGLVGSTLSFSAQISINKIHSCLALTGFVYQKVNDAKTYSTEDIALIRAGLKSYGLYLDRDVIDPKLLRLYGGNVSQANVMKRLFNRQQSTFTEHLEERYSERHISTEYVRAIKECSTQTGTEVKVASDLRKALNTMKKS